MKMKKNKAKGKRYKKLSRKENLMERIKLNWKEDIGF